MTSFPSAECATTVFFVEVIAQIWELATTRKRLLSLYFTFTNLLYIFNGAAVRWRREAHNTHLGIVSEFQDEVVSQQGIEVIAIH